MTAKDKKLKPKGSKPRCNWLTHGTPEQVASRLTKLVEPYGTVLVKDHWMPEGFCQIEEAELDKYKAQKLIPEKEQREKLSKWWLAFPGGANTPNWDIASTCTLNGKCGLLLVEAKAHTEELKSEEKGKELGDEASEESRCNHEQIGKRIKEACAALANETEPGWALSRDHCYQMSNRFAWAWKLTTLGYPVILVYLGFINAEEMKDGKNQNPFAKHTEWESTVKLHGKDSRLAPLVPQSVWNRKWPINGQFLVPRICSLEIPYDAPMQDNSSWRCLRA